MSSPELPHADTPGADKARGRRRTAGVAAVLVAGGAVAGGILTGTLGASAATSPSPSPSTSDATPPGSAAPNAAAPAPGDADNDHTEIRNRGTIAAVGTDTVTIKTATATTPYSVTSASVLDKNGAAAKLTDLLVGDMVVFDTTTQGGTVISHLSDGLLGRGGHGFGGPGRGAGGPGGALQLTGTVAAVGPASVTIKTSTATSPYTVSSATDIDKNGEAKLTDLKVGDAVIFDTTTPGGTEIGHLHAGDEALNRPAGHPGEPAGPEAPAPSASTTGTTA